MIPAASLVAFSNLLEVIADKQGNPPDKKWRILCLHGYLQNAEVFSGKAGSLRKAMKSRAVFHFVDAPHLVTASSREAKASGGTEDAPRGWWTWKDLGPGMRPSLAAQYSGWEDSLESLLTAIKEVQPDGILGFSQGATAAALLMAHLAEQGLENLQPKFAVLIAGFLPRDERHAGELRKWDAKTPLLIVHGDADALVPVERSQQLEAAIASGNSNIERFCHSGAHMVPSCSGLFKKTVQDFFDRQKC